MGEAGRELTAIFTATTLTLRTIRKIRAECSLVSKKSTTWAAPGDVNAFFGLMLDNIADLVLTVSLLSLVFAFPTDFALEHLVPGTAIGVLVGDLLFFQMALSLARKTGRNSITSMPLGLDTPSTFGMVFFVLGPAYLGAKATMGEEQAAIFTWHIGICSIVVSGVFKAACAVGSGWIRRIVPRAGLLGSLAAVALVLISFLPLLEVLHYPVAGLAALAVILTTLVARVQLPGKIPGALGALVVGAAIFYLLHWIDPQSNPLPKTGINPEEALLPVGWLSVFRFEWLQRMPDALHYLPIVIPFALGTVVGGIDCTESAAAAGDEYPTGKIIGVEAFATLVAGLCGGVIQTTPYIGHPAYKAMGGRAAYTLATALFVGAAGVFGFFGYLYAFIPKAALFPILIFIGLEITAQSFHATPKRHFAALALACVPAMAALVLIFTGNYQGDVSGQAAGLKAEVAELSVLAEEANSTQALAPAIEKLNERVTAVENLGSGNIGGPLGKDLQTLRMLGAGFIVTSLLWAAALAHIIDRRFLAAATFLLVAAVCSAFGVIHSPLPGSPLVNPFSIPDLPSQALGQTPLYMAAAYTAMALLLAAWSFLLPAEVQTAEGEQ